MADGATAAGFSAATPRGLHMAPSTTKSPKSKKARKPATRAGASPQDAPGGVRRGRPPRGRGGKRPSARRRARTGQGRQGREASHGTAGKKWSAAPGQRRSGLDAAARILVESKRPMSAK